MPRKRTISPGFFSNEELCCHCSHAARLFYAGLWCWADREGRLQDRPRKLRAEIFPHEPHLDGEALVSELANHGFILRYRVGDRNLIAIPTFLEHQNPYPREAPSKLPAPPEVAPKHNLGHAMAQPRLSPGRADPVTDPVTATATDPGQDAAAAADRLTNGKEARHGRRPPATPPGEARKLTTPPDEVQPAEQQDLLDAIFARGLSRTLARRYVRSSDPALIRELLGFYDDELRKGRLKNPPGALRRLLEDPENWGLELVEGHWIRPRDSPAGPKVESTKEKHARIAREMAAARAEAKKYRPA